MARLVPDADGNCRGACGNKTPSKAAVAETDENDGGCASSNANGGSDSMADMENHLQQDEQAKADGMETEVKLAVQSVEGQRHDRRTSDGTRNSVLANFDIDGRTQDRNATITSVPIRPKRDKNSSRKSAKDSPVARQKLGQCERCGYLSSQSICKACVLLEGLNKARPRTGIEVGEGGV